MLPVLSGEIDDDDLTVNVSGAPQSILELLELNTTGGVVQVLGTATVAAGETSVDITLISALSQGTQVAVRVQGASTYGAPSTVAAPLPKVDGISPSEITGTGTVVVTVTGSGFTSSTTIRLNDPEPDTGLAPVTLALTGTSTSVTATIPDLTSEPGVWRVEIFEGSEVVGSGTIRVNGP
jgi:hypothetical protein